MEANIKSFLQVEKFLKKNGCETKATINHLLLTIGLFSRKNEKVFQEKNTSILREQKKGNVRLIGGHTKSLDTIKVRMKVFLSSSR